LFISIEYYDARNNEYKIGLHICTVGLTRRCANINKYKIR